MNKSGFCAEFFLPHSASRSSRTTMLLFHGRKSSEIVVLCRISLNTSGRQTRGSDPQPPLHPLAFSTSPHRKIVGIEHSVDRMTIFDPEATWKRKEVYHFEARELLVPIFKNGELVYKQPSLEEIRAYCAAQVDTLWDEVKRFDNPHRYYVDLSQKLYDIKQELLTKNGSH